MSLAGGLFFLFFVGGVALHGQLKGFGVGAGGGVTIFFLMQFVINPVPGCGGPAQKNVEWNAGHQMGELVDSLRQERATGEAGIPKIEISPAEEDRILHFDPRLPRVTGDSWAELLEHVCDSTNGCLVCEISRDRRTVRLSTAGQWSKTMGSDPTNYSYSCK
jgi:hypothetical protein